MIYLTTAAGFVLMFVGAELMIRGAVTVANALKVPPLVIGLTLVGFGTSAPELVASVNAALDGAPGIAMGNIVGSNISNILLICGMAAAIRPMRASPVSYRRDGPMIAFATLVLVVMALLGGMDKFEGVFCLGTLIAYVVYTVRVEQRSYDASAAHHTAAGAQIPRFTDHTVVSLGIALLGLLMLMAGAELLISGAVSLAERFGVSDSVIGLSLVAVGTSLPELMTSGVAALKRQPDIAIGNIVGSNIYNSLGITGVTALIVPLPVAREIVAFDIWVMAGATALLGWFALTGWRIDRREGAVFLLLYAGYVATLVSPELRAAIIG